MSYKPFPRPWNTFNALVDGVVGQLPVRHRITEGDVQRWKRNAVDSFRKFVGDEQALERAIEDSIWRISQSCDYDSAWSLEVTFNGRQPPIVNVFQNAIWTRLLVSRALFDAIAQTAVDHGIGHLYAFYRGEDDYGEAVACYSQYQAARYHPEAIFRLIQACIPALHWFHKNIPLKNYSRDKHSNL